MLLKNDSELSRRGAEYAKERVFHQKYFELCELYYLLDFSIWNFPPLRLIAESKLLSHHEHLDTKGRTCFLKCYFVLRDLV